MEGSNTRVHIEHRVLDTFQADIPKHFEKIGPKYYYIEHINIFNWFGAAEKCRQFDAHLINLQDNIELYNVGLNLNQSLNYWTDLNNLVNRSIFYSLTTGTSANLLNDQLKSQTTHDINMCGLIQFDNNTSNFILAKHKCVDKKAYFICETTQPTTISFLLW
ncbi:accessory gland protein Acp29AB [Drosophila novamexicana]|uniref:accessory gland protein Acp29AB n=1 Tax=Drosophila novamexicana TaxID=47314 RepID=UPI0011E5FB62|nr:accessory gland protein Acp29AB [Drosophila novamexicana]